MEKEWCMEDWISICDFLEERKSNIRSGPTLFEDWTDIQDKSGRRGPIFFEDSAMEIQDKNSLKRTCLAGIQMGYVP